MARATMVVGHGGHGTTMRALRHGLPIVGIPAKGGGQAPILAIVADWGAGLSLPGDTETEQIRAAVETVLGDVAFGEEARRRSAAFGPGLTDGATLAAESLERLLPPR